MKSSKMWIRICNIACALLLIALLVFQFMPFWSMPACEVCQVRCELDTNDDCPACAITKSWCVVPTSCNCETKCASSKTANPSCPICTEKYRLCVAESRVVEATEATGDATEATVDTTEATADATEPTVEATEPTVDDVAEEVELELVPIAPIPEVREGVQISIQQYTWMPTFPSCEGVTEYFESEYDDFKINDIILMPALTLIVAAFMIFFGILKNKSWACLLALFGGLFAAITYLTQPIFQAGSNWQLHLYLSIAIAVIALIPAFAGLISLLRKLIKKNK